MHASQAMHAWSKSHTERLQCVKAEKIFAIAPEHVCLIAGQSICHALPVSAASPEMSLLIAGTLEASLLIAGTLEARLLRGILELRFLPGDGRLAMLGD